MGYQPIMVSICIPAYKRVDFLKRLLDSVALQLFTDFEVIVTDDSPGNDVNDLCNQYKDKFTVYYFKNAVPLGTPENWNESIRHARGEWIKLMHDDDWFADRNSLLEFVSAVKQNPSSSFFYSGYINVFENGSRSIPVYINSFRKRKLQQNPVTLFSKNVIGPPSVALVRNNNQFWYDNRIKWVVDIDFYTRYLENNCPFYIHKLLVKVGINKEQVTKSAFRVPIVEIPENFYYLKKVGIKSLKEILVYDACWRLIRNLKITSLEKIRENGYHDEIHYVIQSMIKWQSKIAFRILQIGLLSKLFMIIHYLIHRRFLK